MTAPPDGLPSARISAEERIESLLAYAFGADGRMILADLDSRYILVRVASRTDVRKPFVAGLLYDHETDRVVFTAPILRPLKGLSAEQLRSDARDNGWRLTIAKVPDATAAEPASAAVGVPDCPPAA